MTEGEKESLEGRTSGLGPSNSVRNLPLPLRDSDNSSYSEFQNHKSQWLSPCKK